MEVFPFCEVGDRGGEGGERHRPRESCGERARQHRGRCIRQCQCPEREPHHVEDDEDAPPVESIGEYPRQRRDDATEADRDEQRRRQPDRKRAFAYTVYARATKPASSPMLVNAAPKASRRICVRGEDIHRIIPCCSWTEGDPGAANG